MKTYFITILTFVSTWGYAQNINLANFTLYPTDKEVLLYWTIEKGAACNGITILRSEDSLNYEVAGNIHGICGSISEPISYTFVDKSPKFNKRNFFKLKLGDYQFSEVKSIQVTSIELGKALIKPNPSSDFVTIEINNDNNKSYLATLINNEGRIVYTQNNIVDKSFTIDLTLFKTGHYILFLISSNGDIISEKILISR